MNKSKTEFGSVKEILNDNIDFGLLSRNTNAYFMHIVNNEIKVERFIFTVNDFDSRTFNLLPASEIDTEKNPYVGIISSVKDMIDSKHIFINLKIKEEYIKNYSNDSNCLDKFTTSDFDKAIYLKNKSAIILYNSNEEADLFDSIFIRLFINDLILKNITEISLNCLDIGDQDVKFDVSDSALNCLAPDLSLDIESIIRNSLAKFENLLSEKVKDENLVQRAVKEYTKIQYNVAFYKISFN